MKKSKFTSDDVDDNLCKKKELTNSDVHNVPHQGVPDCPTRPCDRQQHAFQVMMTMGNTGFMRTGSSTEAASSHAAAMMQTHLLSPLLIRRTIMVMERFMISLLSSSWQQFQEIVYHPRFNRLLLIPNQQRQPQHQRRQRRLPRLPGSHGNNDTIRGLVNFGQTCFLNAVLQSLASLEPCMDYLDQVADHIHYHYHNNNNNNNNNMNQSNDNSANSSSSISWTLLQLLEYINGNDNNINTRPDPRAMLQCSVARRHCRDEQCQSRGSPPGMIMILLGKEYQQQQQQQQQDAQEFLQLIWDWIVDEAQECLDQQTSTLFPPLESSKLESWLGDENDDDEYYTDDDDDDDDDDDKLLACSSLSTAAAPVLIDSMTNTTTIFAAATNHNSKGATDDATTGANHSNGEGNHGHIGTNTTSSPPSPCRMEENKLDFDIQDTKRQRQHGTTHDHSVSTATTASMSASLASSSLTTSTMTGESYAVPRGPRTRDDTDDEHQDQSYSAKTATYESSSSSFLKHVVVVPRLPRLPASPLHGWIGSTLQCCKCQYIRPIQNAPFMDLPMIPTSLYVTTAASHSSSLSSQQSPVSPRSRQPSCTIEQCLADFCAVERVQDVECLACTKHNIRAKLKEDEDYLQAALHVMDRRRQQQQQRPKPGSLPMGNNGIVGIDDNEALVKELQLVQDVLARLDTLDMEELVSKIKAFPNSQKEEDEDDNDHHSFHDDVTMVPEDQQLWSLLSRVKVERGEAKKCLILTRLPSVLCLHVQRRFYDHTTNRMAKTIQHVEFPELLDVSPYFAFGSLSVPWMGTFPIHHHPKESFSSRSSPVWYRLQSVLEHRGDAFHGHYMAYRRDSFGGWVLVSDETVTRVSWQQVRHCQAYMLFYQMEAHTSSLYTCQ